ncbi:hypothetical protein GTP38_14570 [Duganella sp. FT94W]|uniref:Uncharacterized protein n=1 Tax=Duganella lactea TaxID=2692173 RepID=A0ABW9V9Y3_9BURK|nr:hypothetical protein [Duganella lactea]MYM35557.1 hypothetical protein [Duganella lactea]
MVRLQRLTTEYDAAQDRIRLSGLDAERRPHLIWLTRRLLRLLVPALVRWLEQHDGVVQAAVVQSFAQEVARAGIVPQTAVNAASGPAWLAQAVDLGRAGDLLSLSLRDGAGATVTVMLSARQLRQWLSMLQHGAVQGDWDLAEWPAWMSPELAAPEGSTVLH